MNPDGSLSYSYEEGMPGRDFAVGSIMSKAEASLNKQKQKASSNKSTKRTTY